MLGNGPPKRQWGALLRSETLSPASTLTYRLALPVVWELLYVFLLLFGACYLVIICQPHFFISTSTSFYVSMVPQPSYVILSLPALCKIKVKLYTDESLNLNRWLHIHTRLTKQINTYFCIFIKPNSTHFIYRNCSECTSKLVLVLIKATVWILLDRDSRREFFFLFLYFFLFYKIKLVHVKTMYDSCKIPLTRRFCVLGFSLCTLESGMFAREWDWCFLRARSLLPE